VEDEVKRLLTILAALSPMLLSGLAAAQSERFELTPMVGYRIESDLSDDNSYKYESLNIENTISFGIAFDYHISRTTDAEFNYSYTNSKGTAVPRGNLAPERSFGLGIHDVQFAGIWHTAPLREPVRPFIGFGLGFTILSPSEPLESHTKFTMSLAGGVKLRMNDKIGFRLEARWIPTYLFTTEGGYWCDPFYGCYYFGNDHFLNSVDFRAGVIFKF
jgi:outer membrane protein with beta-barrel domain